MMFPAREPAVVWTSAATRSFIGMYESHPCLYDLTNKEYHSREKRRAALLDIADALDTTADEVSKKIRSIRAQYSREKKLQRSRGGGAGGGDQSSMGGGRDRKWCFLDQLAFLDGFVTSKVDLVTMATNSAAVARQQREEDRKQHQQEMCALLGPHNKAVMKDLGGHSTTMTDSGEESEVLETGDIDMVSRAGHTQSNAEGEIQASSLSIMTMSQSDQSGADEVPLAAQSENRLKHSGDVGEVVRLAQAIHNKSGTLSRAPPPYRPIVTNTHGHSNHGVFSRASSRQSSYFQGRGTGGSLASGRYRHRRLSGLGGSGTSMGPAKPHEVSSSHGVIQNTGGLFADTPWDERGKLYTDHILETSAAPKRSNMSSVRCDTNRRSVGYPRNLLSRTQSSAAVLPPGARWSASVPMDEDEEAVFGKLVAFELRAMPDSAVKHLVKFRIQSVIYEANAGLLRPLIDAATAAAAASSPSSSGIQAGASQHGALPGGGMSSQGSVASAAERSVHNIICGPVISQELESGSFVSMDDDVGDGSHSVDAGENGKCKPSSLSDDSEDEEGASDDLLHKESSEVDHSSKCEIKTEREEAVLDEKVEDN